MTKMDVAEPGETYLLFFDFTTNQNLNMGNNERFHNELSGYNIFWQSFNKEEYERKQVMVPMEFLKGKKEDLKKNYRHLDEFLVAHPFLSDRFKYFQRTNTRFGAASELMQRRFKLDRNKSELFPEGFMEYIEDTLYRNDPVKPVTLVGEYLSFMRDYIGYEGEKNGPKSYSVGYCEIFMFLHDNDRMKLTDEELQLIPKFQEVDKISMKLFLEKSDSIKREEVLNPYMDVKNSIGYWTGRKQPYPIMPINSSKKESIPRHWRRPSKSFRISIPN